MTKTVIVPLDGSDFALRALPVGDDRRPRLRRRPPARDHPDDARRARSRRASGVVTRGRGHHRSTNGSGASSCPSTTSSPRSTAARHASRSRRCAWRPAAAAHSAPRCSGAWRNARCTSSACRPRSSGPNCDTEWDVSGPVVVCHDGSVASDAILPDRAGMGARARREGDDRERVAAARRRDRGRAERGDRARRRVLRRRPRRRRRRADAESSSFGRRASSGSSTTSTRRWSRSARTDAPPWAASPSAASPAR